MVPPTGCVSTMILPPTRCSLIVNRTAAATVHSPLSGSNEAFAPPRLRRLTSDGRLMMALCNAGSTPSWRDFGQKSKISAQLQAAGSATDSVPTVWITSRFGWSHPALIGSQTSCLFVNSVVRAVEWSEYLNQCKPPSKFGKINHHKLVLLF